MRGLFHQVDPDFSLCFARVVSRSLPSGDGLPEDIEFIQEIPIYWKFEGHSILFDNSQAAFSIAGISCQNSYYSVNVFSAQKAGKDHFFLKLWLEFQL